MAVCLEVPDFSINCIIILINFCFVHATVHATVIIKVDNKIIDSLNRIFESIIYSIIYLVIDSGIYASLSSGEAYKDWRLGNS